MRSYKRHAPEMCSHARLLYGNGLSVSEIATKLDVSRSTVGGWVRGMERGPRWCPLCENQVPEERTLYCSDRCHHTARMAEVESMLRAASQRRRGALVRVWGETYSRTLPA